MNPFYITTPIYYVNDKPHIGHAYTTIACDIIARFNKLLNKDVYFLTGTDEHGQKVEKAAKESNLSPQLFVDNISQSFKKLIPDLGCEINDFIRTTEERHIHSAKYLWRQLEKNNQIYLSNYEGWYSVRDEAFYSENELEKKDGKFFTNSGEEVEWLKEESYFFKLSEWQDKLIKYYEENPDSIKPKSRFNEVLSFIKGGLKDLSISRTTFNWGIPVPDNDKHVMYVWIDALCNYLTSIDFSNNNSSKFKKYWPALHVVGKDILRFHAVYWPAFLMAANIEPPKQIFAHGWWTNDGQKISKSLGNVIDPYKIISEFGLDQFRFYLFRDVPFGNDGDFSIKAFSNRINADLSNNLGNLVQRVTAFIEKNSEKKVKNNFNLKKEDKDILVLSEKKLKNYIKYMSNLELDKSLKEIFDILTEANIYVNNQAPWKLKNIDINRMNVVLSVSIELIKRCNLLLFPFIPRSSVKIFKLLNINYEKLNYDNICILPDKEISINSPEPVFPRIQLDD